MGELVRRVSLAVRLKEVSGGMVGVRAGEQESLEHHSSAAGLRYRPAMGKMRSLNA
jgi:hypothetical protein